MEQGRRRIDRQCPYGNRSSTKWATNRSMPERDLPTTRRAQESAIALLKLLPSRPTRRYGSGRATGELDCHSLDPLRNNCRAGHVGVQCVLYRPDQLQTRMHVLTTCDGPSFHLVEESGHVAVGPIAHPRQVVGPPSEAPGGAVGTRKLQPGLLFPLRPSRLAKVQAPGWMPYMVCEADTCSQHGQIVRGRLAQDCILRSAVFCESAIKAQSSPRWARS